jgi:hypothetical protein
MLVNVFLRRKLDQERNQATVGWPRGDELVIVGEEDLSLNISQLLTEAGSLSDRFFFRSESTKGLRARKADSGQTTGNDLFKASAVPKDMYAIGTE